MNLSQATPRKRFYKSAAVTEPEPGRFSIVLDGRPVKTPAGHSLTVRSRALAQAIAEEWNAQEETIVPLRLPLTRLANSAIDGVVEKLAEVADGIVKFAATDLVCYRADYPEELVSKQKQTWDPILAFIKDRYGASFVTGTGIAYLSQPRASLEALRAALRALNPFKLTALHAMTALTGSALIAIAGADGFLDADAAWTAAHVDETWQGSQWGQDFEAAHRMEARRAEFDAAALFYRLA
jgi:chaperone required for assembly of F1-ATPase